MHSTEVVEFRHAARPEERVGKAGVELRGLYAGEPGANGLKLLADDSCGSDRMSNAAAHNFEGAVWRDDLEPKFLGAEKCRRGKRYRGVKLTFVQVQGNADRLQALNENGEDVQQAVRRVCKRNVVKVGKPEGASHVVEDIVQRVREEPA
jgi:hypothetical protein